MKAEVFWWKLVSSRWGECLQKWNWGLRQRREGDSRSQTAACRRVFGPAGWALSRLPLSFCALSASQIQISKCGATAEATSDFLFRDFQPVARWHKQLSAVFILLLNTTFTLLLTFSLKTFHLNTRCGAGRGGSSACLCQKLSGFITQQRECCMFIMTAWSEETWFIR